MVNLESGVENVQILKVTGIAEVLSYMNPAGNNLLQMMKDCDN